MSSNPDSAMFPKVWTPHMTVAAVIERDGRYLMVEEMSNGRRVYNQPAGHLEPNEALTAAVTREVLEEAGAAFEPEALVGLYRWINPASGHTHLRVAFCGSASDPDPDRPLDDPIIRAVWRSYEELRERPESLRSPLVLGCIDDYLSGRRIPLEFLRDFA